MKRVASAPLCGLQKVCIHMEGEGEGQLVNKNVIGEQGLMVASLLFRVARY